MGNRSQNEIPSCPTASVRFCLSPVLRFSLLAQPLLLPCLHYLHAATENHNTRRTVRDQVQV